MSMIVLPVVDRELRVAARRPGTYRTRLWAALAAILLAAWQSLGFAWQGSPVAVQGRSLFYTLSGLAFVYSLFIGARVTADCISEEKREGTLGLLFLTDLKGLDVVLGKLVASSLNSFYGLCAVLPLLAMPLLLGGVTFSQFGQMVLVLIDTLFFSLSMGIFVSALSRNERRSMMATSLLILSPAAIPFCVIFFLVTAMEVLQNASDATRLLPWLMANPIYAYLISLPPVNWLPMTLIPKWSFWVSLAVVHGFSWLALLVTAWILPAVWKDRPKAPRPSNRIRRIERWRTWVQGTTEQRRALRVRLLPRNPFLWLVSRDRLKPAYAWFFLVSMVAVWAWGYWQHRDVMFDFYPLVPTILMIHSFLKVWVCTEVSHRLVEDQRNGAFELLLSTPLTIKEILRGQRLALLRQFRGPILVLCGLELVVFQGSYSPSTIVLLLGMLIADLITLMWVAMRLSFGARSINEVLVKSVLWVMAFPWMAYLVLFPFSQWFWRHFFWRRWRPSFDQKFYFWWALGIAIDLVLVLAWARPQLLALFRETGAATRAALSRDRRP